MEPAGQDSSSSAGGLETLTAAWLGQRLDFHSIRLTENLVKSGFAEDLR